MKTIKYSIIIVCCVAALSSLCGQTYNEILGRPTNTSVTMSILFDQSSEVYWGYGVSSGSYSVTTPSYNAAANIPLEVDFKGLNANTKYYYRTRYRLSGSSSVYSVGTEHSFFTQRAPGSTFTFTVEADEHLYERQYSQNLYKIVLANQQKDNGDFMISLGDIFGNDASPATTTSAEMKSLHLFYRKFLGAICPSVPFYVCLGNHEGEMDYYLKQNPPNNIAAYATLWRKYYYPNPFPNEFYSGDTLTEDYGMGQPQNYYSWTWGEALFVVTDDFRYQCDTSADPKKWNWSLGQTQYNWLKTVLQGSSAKYKFVFTHHPNGQQRGGATIAKMYEWGGYEKNISGNMVYAFDKNRPGWGKSIHQLMVDNKVNVLFQGHDHVFAKEDLDGIVYQEVPMPADSTYIKGFNDWGSYYSQNVMTGCGHIRVSVSPTGVKVEFVRAYLPKDEDSTHHNGEVAFSYMIPSSTSLVSGEKESGKTFSIEQNYPNPFNPETVIKYSLSVDSYVSLKVYDLLGREVVTLVDAYQRAGEHSAALSSRLMIGRCVKFSSGMYYYRITAGNYSACKKMIYLK